MKTLIIILFMSAPFSLCFGQWKSINKDIIGPWYLGKAIDVCDSSNIILAGTNYPKYPVYQSTDGGLSWQELIHPTLGGKGSITDISMTDSMHIWFTTGNPGAAIYGSKDGGKNWRLQFSDSTLTIFMNYIEMFDSLNGIAMGDRVTSDKPTLFLNTTNGGETWSIVMDSAITASSDDLWRRLDFISPDTGFFFTSGLAIDNLYATDDGAYNWHTINYPIRNCSVLKFYNSRIGLVLPSMQTGWIWRTVDGGASWRNFKTGHKGWGNDIEFIPGNPAKVWMTDYHNLFFSEDTGRTWTNIVINDSTVRGRDIVFTDKNHGWLLCDQGVLYKIDNADLVTSVERSERIMPSQIILKQNYPNPFNAATVIEFFVQMRATVDIRIFDNAARELELLTKKEYNSGTHSLTWDAKRYSSGIYYISLQTDNTILSRKALLIK